MKLKIYPTIERHCPDSLSSGVWSGVPLELLTMIIDLTTDKETLDSWCEATQESHHLHEAAMTARWRNVTIDDRDLLPAPGDDEELFNRIRERLQRFKLGQDWKPAGEMINTLLSTTNNESGCCPANYVQHLVFDFRLLRYWVDDIQEYWEYMSGDSEDEEEIPTLNAHNLVPTENSLRHTLPMLKGHFHNLRYVSCYGDTPQAILDFATSQDAAKIGSFEMRSLGAFSRLQTDFAERPPFSSYLRRWPLRLEELSTLHQLKALDIHRLSKYETAGLLAALHRLIELQCLTLACEAQEHADHYGGCALKSLFNQVFQNYDTVGINSNPVTECLPWLPPSLKSLSLIDTGYDSKSVTMPFIQPPRLGNHLTHLCVDIGNVDWIPVLVDSFPEGTLQFLSIPGRSRDAHISVCGDHAHVEHAITKHKEPLAKIRLVRAWETDRRWIDELNDRWQGTYAVQELVLGTKNPRWYEGFVEEWRKYVPEPTLSHYLYGFERAPHLESGRWGHNIQRIRIDHIDISPNLEVSVLGEPCYSHLKILMFQPGPRRTASNNSPPRCEAFDEAVFTKLAKRITTHGASSLRVIVIATYWYWVSQDRAGSEPYDFVWTWADAQADSTQKELISSTLSQDDLDFLERSTVPFWQERDSREWHRNLAHYKRTRPYEPSREMLHQWNYLTMLPVHEE